MKKMAHRIVPIALIFILAGFPLLLGVDGGRFVFNTYAPLEAAAAYFKGLLTGDSLLFFAGKSPRNFLTTAPMYMLTSALYLFGAALVGVHLGIALGMLSSRLRSGIIKDCIGFLSAVPDFILILLVQRGAVYLHELAGARVLRVATVTLGEPAVLLPLLTMSLLPALYLIRTVASKADYVLAQDYIQYAKAKGLAPAHIYFRHVFPNIIPFIKADIDKIASIMLANLFVAEYLFNIFGVTRLLFKHGFQFFRYSYLVNYQYNLVVNAMLAIILLYEGLKLLLRTYMLCWERRLSR